MNHFFKTLLKKNGVKVALCFIITLVLVDTVFTYRYKYSLNQNIYLQNKLDAIVTRKAEIISNLNNIDMSLRGYLLVQNEAFLGTYDKIKSQSTPTMTFLEVESAWNWNSFFGNDRHEQNAG